MRKNKLIYLILLLLFFACREVETIELKGPEYYAIEVGKYMTYSVNEIKHDAFEGTSDTIQYFIKETVVEQIQDSLLEHKYILKIERSEDGISNWEYVKLVSIYKDDAQIQRYEDDIRKVKLTFPLLLRKYWDCNSYNTQEEQRVRILTLDEAFTSSDSTFAQTATIELADNEDPFFTNIEYEVYAKNLGLIKRTFVDLERQPGKYLKGTEYVQTYKSSNW